MLFSGRLGAGYERRLTFGDFSLAAGASGTMYSHDERWNQIFGLGTARLEIPITNRIRWTLKDQFRPAPIDFSDIEDSRSNTTQYNQAATQLEFHLPLRGKWSSRLKGRFARIDIIDVDNLFAGRDPDRYEYGGELAIERRVSSRWSLGASGYMGRTQFINKQPAFINTFGFGGNLEASYSLRKNTTFSASAGVGRLSSSRFNSNTVIWGIGLDWQMFKRVSIKLKGRRVHTVSLSGSNFTITTASGEIEYSLSRRIQAALSGAWILSKGYATSVGNDQVFHVGTEIKYLIGRNYKTYLRYGFTRNGGDDRPNNDFTRNSVVLGVNAEF